MRSPTHPRHAQALLRPLVVVAALLGAHVARGATFETGSFESPTWTAYKAAPAPEVFQLERLIGGAEGQPTLAILGAAPTAPGAPSPALPPAGAVLKIFRASRVHPDGSAASRPLWVETGRVKVVEAQESHVVAEVLSQGSTLATALFPKFPDLMAGDLATPQRIAVARRQSVLPTSSLTYAELFEDPKAQPGSFEMTGDGEAKLRALAQPFAGARLAMLMVEGYTDEAGPAAANQVESYQRAMTVRQFLIDRLGFDARRVVAVGFGEAEPLDPSLAPGAATANRRIVLKAVALPGK
jgi:outer membrane protein OmpA-like peptidoglycan-associated protein